MLTSSAPNDRVINVSPQELLMDSRRHILVYNHAAPAPAAVLRLFTTSLNLFELKLWLPRRWGLHRSPRSDELLAEKNSVLDIDRRELLLLSPDGIQTLGAFNGFNLAIEVGATTPLLVTPFKEGLIWNPPRL